MKRLTKNTLAIITVLALVLAMFPMVAVVASAGEPTVIKHTFGGANGVLTIKDANGNTVS